MLPGATRIFVSYTRDDSEQALKLTHELKTAGVNVWLDQLDIPPGARWDQTVEEALEQSTCLIVILSPRSVASQNVMDEVSYAIDEKKEILPVLIERCKVPLRLRRLQFIDFTDDYSSSLKKLLRLLHAVPQQDEQVKDHAKASTQRDPKRPSARTKDRAKASAQGDPKRPSGRSDVRKEWRSELISKGWVERSIRVFLTHDTHVIDLRVHFFKLVTVVRIDGITCATEPLKEGLSEFKFQLADGPHKYSATIEVSRSFLTEQIKECRLKVGGRLLYSE